MGYLYACWQLAAFTAPCFILGVVVGWFARRAMKPLLIGAVAVSATRACDAGLRTMRLNARLERREARVQVRAIEAQTGVAHLKWRTRLTRAQVARNVTAPLGWLNPVNWLIGVL